MGGQVLEGSLAGDNGLGEEAEHGEHGEAAVLDLLDLELSEGLWVVSQVEGVEGSSGVEGVEALNAWCLTSVTEGLSLRHHDDLEGQGGDDALGVHQRGVACMEKAMEEGRSAYLRKDWEWAACSAW